MINCIPFRKACTGLPKGMHLISEKCALCKRNIQTEGIGLLRETAGSQRLLSFSTNPYLRAYRKNIFTALRKPALSFAAANLS